MGIVLQKRVRGALATIALVIPGMLWAADRNYSWDPQLRSDCFILNDTEEHGWWRFPMEVSPRCNTGEKKDWWPPAWVLASYNEGIPDKYPRGEIIPQSKIGKGKLWDFRFVPDVDNKFSMQMTLDKLGNPDYLDQFTWVGLQDSFDLNKDIPKPSLDEDLYVDLRVAVIEAKRAVNSNVTQALDPKGFWKIGKGRVHLGVMLRWEENNPFRIREIYNLEVVFWRDEEYDGCTKEGNWWGPPSHPGNESCDTSGLYDRRAIWGPRNTGGGGGEAVYYTASGLYQVLGLNMKMLSPGAGFENYRIPISKLVRNYPWKRPPPSWEHVKVAGVYIGIEEWGKARVSFEVKNYRLYAVFH